MNVGLKDRGDAVNASQGRIHIAAFDLLVVPEGKVGVVCDVLLDHIAILAAGPNRSPQRPAQAFKGIGHPTIVQALRFEDHAI